MGGQTLVISSTKEIKLNKAKVAVDSLDTLKSWVVHRLQPRAGKFYGMGAKRFSRYKEAASWLACDENAVVNLAQQAKSKTYELVRHYNSKSGSDFEKIIGQDVRILLENVQITERWLDKKSWTCFCKAVARPRALPPLKKKKIFSNITKKISEKMDSISAVQETRAQDSTELKLIKDSLFIDSIKTDTLLQDSLKRVNELKKELLIWN
jgi:hypothetical protein